MSTTLRPRVYNGMVESYLLDSNCYEETLPDHGGKGVYLSSMNSVRSSERRHVLVAVERFHNIHYVVPPRTGWQQAAGSILPELRAMTLILWYVAVKGWRALQSEITRNRESTNQEMDFAKDITRWNRDIRDKRLG